MELNDYVTWPSKSERRAMDEAAFWAFEVPVGGSLEQVIPRGSQLCLTAAGLSNPVAKGRVVLRVSSNGHTAVMCNLSQKPGHNSARLAQPFHETVTFWAEGSAIHLSGWVRGDLGPLEVKKGGAKEEVAAKKEVAAAAPSKPSKSEEVGSIAAKSRAAVSVAELMGTEKEDDDDDDDDDDEGEEEEGEEEEGEEASGEEAEEAGEVGEGEGEGKGEDKGEEGGEEGDEEVAAGEAKQAETDGEDEGEGEAAVQALAP